MLISGTLYCLWKCEYFLNEKGNKITLIIHSVKGAKLQVRCSVIIRRVDGTSCKEHNVHSLFLTLPRLPLNTAQKQHCHHVVIFSKCRFENGVEVHQVRRLP